jgi:hypothetical protein
VKAHRGLTMERMTELGRVSRSGFYRWDDAEPGADRDMELRDAMQRIAVEWPSYGRPRRLRERVSSVFGSSRPRIKPCTVDLWQISEARKTMFWSIQQRQ